MNALGPSFFSMNLLALSLISCDRDDPEMPNEEKLITKLKFNFLQGTTTGPTTSCMLTIH